jgi:hypothetical protein
MNKEQEQKTLKYTDVLEAVEQLCATWGESSGLEEDAQWS